MRLFLAIIMFNNDIKADYIPFILMYRNTIIMTRTIRITPSATPIAIIVDTEDVTAGK